MAELTVRPVTRADYDAWRPLWDGYNKFYGRHGATALPEVVTQVTWSRFFDSYEPVHGLVAVSDGRIAGLTNYLFHRTTTAVEPLCYLQDLFTLEDVRGRGIGRALIEEVYARAKAAGGAPRLLADARDQFDGNGALQQGCRAFRLSRLSQANRP